MSQTPATTRKTFPEISSRAWEHPADRTALSALRRLKGFDQILKLMSGMLRERQHRLLYLASAARVGPRQFADLDALLDECVDVLDASAKPELYVMQSPIADAFTIGMGKPFTVITSGLYDLVTHDEMRFVMGHELGHALSGHAVYRTMMMHLLRLARSFGVLPVGGWALRAIVAALLEWQRKSELSGDRAGLLCAQDLDTALRVEMKLAGGCRLDKLDSEAFLAQAREYETSGDMRDGAQAAQPGAADPSVLGAAGCRLDSLGGHRRLCQGDSRRVPASGRRRQRQICRRPWRGRPVLPGRLRPVQRPADQRYPRRIRWHRRGRGTGSLERGRFIGPQDHRVAAALEVTAPLLRS